ncbi:MAG: bifunctional folylpolyglutamate synthase/dihydrofolate synthase [Clostridia bacterium]|nr:bifunctional folylpolyglutamate synthase/dihydrofolate synthase [Clostridia bacterium]
MEQLSYAEAVAELKNLARFGINLGLTRIQELLRRLNNPHQQGMRYLHIGGTNGKGSVCAMLEAMLLAEGKTVCLFTSPHLHSYRERFKINGVQAEKTEIAAALSQVIAACEQMKSAGFEAPTEFEVNTAMALLLFAQHRPEWVILEVGMGGDIDSTNVIDGEIAVITEVALEHTAYLGDTVEKIAACKAGIIKRGARVFTGASGSALSIIRSKAEQKQAVLCQIGKELNYKLSQDRGEDGQILTVSIEDKTYANLFIPLLGRHQLANAALAVAAADAAGLSEQAIRTGLKQTRHPGRLEIFSHEPLVVLDGAHNPDGIAALAAALQDYWPQKQKIIIMGMLSDKEQQAALKLILPQAEHLIVTPPPFDTGRVGNWHLLTRLAVKEGKEAVEAETIAEAIEEGINLLNKNSMLLVCGSLYLVAAAREYLAKILLGVDLTD